MKRLNKIPQPEFAHHDNAHTLGDSDEIPESVLQQFDRQLQPHGLELVVFENGAALNWFIQKIQKAP